eukprot:COSAG02_NODE_38169_length_432_cov_1.072072_1_plen_33_part_01
MGRGWCRGGFEGREVGRNEENCRCFVSLNSHRE